MTIIADGRRHYIFTDIEIHHIILERSLSSTFSFTLIIHYPKN